MKVKKKVKIQLELNMKKAQEMPTRSLVNLQWLQMKTREEWVIFSPVWTQEQMKTNGAPEK